MKSWSPERGWQLLPPPAVSVQQQTYKVIMTIKTSNKSSSTKICLEVKMKPSPFDNGPVLRIKFNRPPTLFFPRFPWTSVRLYQLKACLWCWWGRAIWSLSYVEWRPKVVLWLRIFKDLSDKFIINQWDKCSTRRDLIEIDFQYLNYLGS